MNNDNQNAVQEVSPYVGLLVGMIDSAADTYKLNEYPPNIYTDFASPRMESLTWLHSDWLEETLDLVGIDRSYVLKIRGIPQPSEGCACESCRTDYMAEAKAVMDRKGDFRFTPGAKHHVVWSRDRIVCIRPQVDNIHTLTPEEYVEHGKV